MFSYGDFSPSEELFRLHPTLVVKLKAWENTTVTYINMIFEIFSPKLSSGHKSEACIILVQKNVCIYLKLMCKRYY